jgi:hypothetical protein
LNKIVRTINDYINQQFRILRNEELRVKRRPPSTVRIMKSGRLLWAGHAVGMEKARNAFRVDWH